MLFATLASSGLGLPRVDLRARYGAPLDGTSHLLTQAMALAMYPQCGATGPIETDTAAWLQAEYDLRTGPGGIIGLPDWSTMMVSQQLYLQNCDKVWFHGGRGVGLRTNGCGSVPAVRVSGGYSGLFKVPLSDLTLFATASGTVAPSTAGGGTAHGLFVSGATAFQIDQCTGADFYRISWNGYDQPFVWGTNVYGVSFYTWSANGNNLGVNWSQTGGLNSMERIRFQGGGAANNNLGIGWNATYSGNSQGGGVYFHDNQFDYNIVRFASLVGSVAGNNYCNNGMHFTNNYIETTGACSGTTLCRGFFQGDVSASENEFYENDSGVPPGFFEVADGTSLKLSNNRFNGNTPALAWSSTGNGKYVSGGGNRFQDMTRRPVLLRDSGGDLLQSAPSDGTVAYLFNDVDQSLWAKYYRQKLVLFYFGGNGTFTLPALSTFAFRVGDCIEFTNEGSSTITFAAQSGATVLSFRNYPPNPTPSANGPLKLAPGASAIAHLASTSGEWRLAGNLTA